MPVGRIYWGAASSGLTYENELVLGYSLYEPVDDRTPRAGSEWVQAPSGIEDAWLTGSDYVLKCEARWIPDGPASTPQRSPIGGPNSWSQFLDYARGKNVFRFVPYSSLPNFFVDGVYLVEPTSGLGRLDDTKLLRNVPLTFRQASVPWTQAVVRGVALEYAPGQPTTGTGLDAVFARASSAWYAAKSGLLASVPANVARDRTYDGSTVHSLLLEAAGTNYFLYAALSSQWSLNPAVTVAGGQAVAPDGSTNAVLVTGASSGPGATYRGDVVPSTGPATLSVFVAPLDSTTHPELMMLDHVAGAPICVLAWNWSSGVPVISALTAGTTGGFIPCPGTPWYRAWLSATPATSQQAQWVFYPDTNSSGRTLVWMPQLEAGATPTSPMPTTGAAAATRNADSFSSPLPAGFQTPQPSWWYLKFVERGTGKGPTAMRLMSVEDAGADPAALEIYGGGAYGARLYSSSGGTATAQVSTAPSFGDTVELLLTLSSSGNVTLAQVLNGGASTSATATLGWLPRSWSDTKLWLNSEGSVAGYVGWTEFLAVKAGPGTAVNTIAAARSA